MQTSSKGAARKAYGAGQEWGRKARKVEAKQLRSRARRNWQRDQGLKVR